jgi:O-antigen/teichoic acid export membrane protein
LGGGVWALVSGQIIRSIIRTILLYKISKWRPSFHYSFKESKSYLSFGIKIALSRSLFYLQEKSDTFFAGRAWKANILGFYTFALELAQIPTNKIVTTINAVSFPAFSKLQNDTRAFNKLYLNITKVTAMIVFPLFMGGFFLGEDLVHLILNPKWYPIIHLFRLLCLAQILTSLIAVNSFVHTAQGRPGWNVCYNVVCVILMPISFYFAVRHGLNAIIIPWLTTYVVIGVVWINISIKKLKIGLITYCSNFSTPFFGAILMSFAVWVVCKYTYVPFLTERAHSLAIVSISAITGFLVYGLFFWIFDKKFLLSLKGLLKKNN